MCVDRLTMNANSSTDVLCDAMWEGNTQNLFGSVALSSGGMGEKQGPPSDGKMMQPPLKQRGISNEPSDFSLKTEQENELKL